jgi:hypothetical protein
LAVVLPGLDSHIFSAHFFQIHESRSNEDARPEFFFRLIYNGEALTWLVDGCPEYEHLCEVSVLTDRVLAFATRKNGGCGVNEVDGRVPEDGHQNLFGVLKKATTDHPYRTLFLSMMLSFAMGSFLTLGVMEAVGVDL